MKPVREMEYFLAWFVFLVCATIGGFIAGGIGGGLVGGILGASGEQIGSARFTLWCKIGGFIASLPVSYLVFRFVTGGMLINKIATRCSSQAEDTPNMSLHFDADERRE